MACETKSYAITIFREEEKSKFKFFSGFSLEMYILKINKKGKYEKNFSFSYKFDYLSW